MELNSKADEIKAIQKFYNSLPADSYLKSILKGMPEYCERQILDDFGISPLETIEANYKDNTDLRQKIAGLERLKEAQDKELENKAQIIGELEQKIEKIIKDWNCVVEEKNESYKHLYAKYTQVNEAYCNANDKANELHKQVIELKAKLYDYMAGEQDKQG